MPVQKVDFRIENVYDNAKNITERVFLDIWTNGSVSKRPLHLQLKLRLIYLLY